MEDIHHQLLRDIITKLLLSPSIFHFVMEISQKVAGYKAIDSWEKSLTIRGEAWRSIRLFRVELLKKKGTCFTTIKKIRVFLDRRLILST